MKTFYLILFVQKLLQNLLRFDTNVKLHFCFIIVSKLCFEICGNFLIILFLSLLQEHLNTDSISSKGKSDWHVLYIFRILLRDLYNFFDCKTFSAREKKKTPARILMVSFFRGYTSRKYIFQANKRWLWFRCPALIAL